MYRWVVDNFSSFRVVYTPPRWHNIPLYIFTLFLSCHIDLEDIYSPVRTRPWQIRLAFTPKL